MVVVCSLEALSFMICLAMDESNSSNPRILEVLQVHSG
jgi:hypothetical protein